MKTHARPEIPSHWQLNNAYRKNARKHLNSTLLFPYERNPPVTNGLAPQLASDAKALIMQFQDYRFLFHQCYGRNKLLAIVISHEYQWQQLSVLGFHLTDRYIVCSTAVSHIWSFVRRIYWWPMDSPHQGPTKRKTLMCNSRSTFASSILCNISKLSTIVTSYVHHGLHHHWQLYCLFTSQ